MIKIVIVEDDDRYAAQIRGYAEKFATETDERIDIVRYADGVDFLTNYKASADIVLMDIEMPMMNGMDAAKKLRENGDKVPIIFITNMAQYAVRGYEVDAIGFIVKPITYYGFSERLKRAVAAVKAQRDNYLAFAVKDGVVKIYLDDVKYIEVYRHRMQYHTFDEVIEVPGSMRDTADKLADKHFAQCNSGWLVNLKYVDEIKGNTVKVAGEELLVSRNKRREFIQRVTAYFAGGGR